MKRTIYLFGIAGLIACSGTTKVADPQQLKQHGPGASVNIIRYKFAKNELTQLCENAITNTKSHLDHVVTIPPKERTLSNTLLSLEQHLSDFDEVTTPLIFMGYVSRDEWLRKEAEQCEKIVGQFFVDIFTRKDLYESIKDLKAVEAADRRLLTEAKISFEKNGLKLETKKLNELRELKQKLTALETEFAANLNNDKSQELFTEQELAGVPDSFMKRLKKADDGRYIVTTKSTDYLQVMQTAKSADTRRRMMLAYTNRAGEANTKLLEDALQLRQRIAKLLGFKRWADYVTSDRMAKSSRNALSFLNGLRQKLTQRNKSDLAQLLKFKKEIEPGATVIESWDISYLTYQLKKRDFDLDDEKIREYFPTEHVMNAMFDVYSQIFGVRYEVVEDSDVWSPDVRLYRVIDQETNQVVSYFYADFVPREGKYGHAAAFTLIKGRKEGNDYNIPVSAIVANFNPPSQGKPSLLNHSEVETLFHEFGHIMHQTLTRAPYGSLSGTSVKRDFVEAPSQMLENWVWEQDILNRLSGHYSDLSKKLPPELLKRMLEAKDFNQGHFYTRQLFLGLFDLTIHTRTGAIDVTKTHDELYESVLGVKPLKGNRFPAGFGHMMGGYDAGYYGYLWSEVYAQDMFTRFADGHLLDSRVGMDYRRMILESGNMADPLELITKFLGRKPNQNAFFKHLRIKN